MHALKIQARQSHAQARSRGRVAANGSGPGGLSLPSLPRLSFPGLPRRRQQQQQKQQQNQEGYLVIQEHHQQPQPIAPNEGLPAQPGAAVRALQQAAGALLSAASPPNSAVPAQQQQQQQQPLSPVLAQQQVAPVQQQLQNQQQHQPQAPAPAVVDASQQLAFARHLSIASNGLAPLATRMESLTWMVFKTGQLQARVLQGPASDPRSWLHSPESIALLEQVRLSSSKQGFVSHLQAHILPSSCACLHTVMR
jgi:hypothetical protein